MKISDLIVALQKVQNTNGDVQVVWESIERSWPPDLRVKTAARGGEKYLVLNG